MKILTKTIVPAMALGLLGFGFISHQAKADQINGEINIQGQAIYDTGNIDTANAVNSWVGATVSTVTLDLDTFINPSMSVTMASPWTFDPSTATSGLWSVGGFTFNLTSSTISFQGLIPSTTLHNLTVVGSGTIIGNGFDPTPGTWIFSSNKSGSASSASFGFTADASGQPVPDGGSTVALLGLALTAIPFVRRKFSAINA